MHELSRFEGAIESKSYMEEVSMNRSVLIGHLPYWNHFHLIGRTKKTALHCAIRNVHLSAWIASTSLHLAMFIPLTLMTLAPLKGVPFHALHFNYPSPSRLFSHSRNHLHITDWIKYLNLLRLYYCTMHTYK